MMELFFLAHQWIVIDHKLLRFLVIGIYLFFYSPCSTHMISLIKVSKAAYYLKNHIQMVTINHHPFVLNYDLN